MGSLSHAVSLVSSASFFLIVTLMRLGGLQASQEKQGVWPLGQYHADHEIRFQTVLYWLGMSSECFFDFFRSIRKMAWDGPKWGRDVFFRRIQTLPTFWATWILILRLFMLGLVLDPKFPRFRNSRTGPPPFCCNISEATSAGNTHAQMVCLFRLC